MRNYLELMQRVLTQGSWQNNRTGIRACTVPGAMLSFDLNEGFPAITTRRLPFKTFTAELVAFLAGAQNASTFRQLGTKIWDANANHNAAWLANPYRKGEDDLGRIYGAQWRHWRGYKVVDPHSGLLASLLAEGWCVIGHTVDHQSILHRSIDQMAQCLDTIHHDPTNRRILFHAWNPAELDEMALPPCHLLYQFTVDGTHHELSLCVYQRSVDVPLGLIGNITEAALLLSIFARLTGYTPRYLTWFGANVHIYENQLDMVTTQLARTPYPLPQLAIDARIPCYNDTQHFEPHWLNKVRCDDFSLLQYQHHPPLTAPMAI